MILKDPRLIVLDEATSHMDSASEALVREALSHVMQGRTSLVIAHLPSVRLCDPGSSLFVTHLFRFHSATAW